MNIICFKYKRYFIQQMSDSSASIQSRLQSIVDKVSQKSKYQRHLIIFMCLLWLQITYSAMLGSYIFMNPLFECDGKSATQVEACPYMTYFNQSGYQEYQKCKITNDFTATYYNHLYCEGKQKRSAIQSIYAFGALIGMFGLPALSDSKGRRFSLLLSFWLQLIGISGMIAGVYLNIFVLTLIGQFLTGIQASGMVILTYVITGEFCKQSTKQSAILLYCAFWGLGEISFFFFYNFLPQWNYYLIFVLHIPSILLMIISYFLILETPQYCLIMAKNTDMLNSTLQKLGLYNQANVQKIEQAKNLAKQLLQQQQKTSNALKSSNFKQIMTKIFTKKLYLRTCLCLALTQLAYNIFYYGVQGSLQRTGYNFGLSMLLIGVHQFFAYLSTSYVINKVKRKKGLIIAILLTSSIGLTFLIPAVTQNQVIQSIVISITRIGCVYSYSFLSILETQSFSSQIKSTAIGLTIGLSQVGRIAVPYIVTAMNDAGIHPLIVSSISFLLFGIVPLIPIRETFKKSQKKKQDKESLLGEQTNQ